MIQASVVSVFYDHYRFKYFLSSNLLNFGGCEMLPLLFRLDQDSLTMFIDNINNNLVEIFEIELSLYFVEIWPIFGLCWYL